MVNRAVLEEGIELSATKRTQVKTKRGAAYEQMINRTIEVSVPWLGHKLQ